MSKLTIEEKDLMIPELLKFINHIPKTSFQLIDYLTSKGFKTNGIRIRMMIHEIRIKQLMLIISSQKGYYTTDNYEEIMGYLVGLRLRAQSILMAAHEIEQLAKTNEAMSKV